MSKKEKPILNLQKGCPFCGNPNLVSEYSPTQIASQKHMEMMLKTARPYLYRKYKEWQKENVK